MKIGRTFKNGIERCTLKTVSQTDIWTPSPGTGDAGKGRRRKDWQDNTFYESLILAQDERWRRA